MAALIGACAALGLAGLALADTITGDANSVTTNIDPSVTVSQGSSGSGKFGLVVNDNAADPVNGCNAGTGGSKPPVVLSVASNQPWLTLGQSTITLTGCDNGTTADGLQNAANVSFSVANNAPAGATATVTASYQSGGASGGTYTSGSFQVKTPAAPPNTAPSKPGKPSASSSLNNDGVFRLDWTAASDPDNNVDHYALQHKDADDAGYSPVSGAGSLGASAFAFSASAPEGEGTWTYQAKAVDAFGEDGPYSAASDPVKVDKSAPSAPTASFDRAPEDATGNWFKDSVGQLRWQQRSEARRRQRRKRRRRLHGRPDVQHVRVPRLLGEGHRQGWERLRAGDRHGQGGRHRPGRDPDLPDESGRSWQQRLSELDGRGCPLRGRRGRQRLDLARHERGRPEDGLRAGWHRPRQRRTRVRRGELPVPGGL